MKKIIKIVGIVLLSILCIYTIFVIEESIRLYKNVDANPFFIKSVEIVCDECVNSSVVTHSLGFKTIKKYVTPQVDDVDSKDLIVGEEFWLFDMFML